VLIPLDDIGPDPNNVRSDFRPVDCVVASAVSAALRRFADNMPFAIVRMYRTHARSNHDDVCRSAMVGQ
jgi:hypothetical protein